MGVWQNIFIKGCFASRIGAYPAPAESKAALIVSYAGSEMSFHVSI